MRELENLIVGLQILIGELLSPPWLYVTVVVVLGGMLLHARFAPGNYTVPMVTAIVGAVAFPWYAADLWSRGAGWRGFSEISDYEIRTISPYLLSTVICVGVAVASYYLNRPRARQQELARQELIRERGLNKPPGEQRIPGTGPYQGLIWDGLRWNAPGPNDTLIPIDPDKRTT